MAYTSVSINNLIDDINKRKYFLPAIQRKFVWREDKICDLFNSIMRGYPIGTFLFWELTAEKAKSYTFYEFLKNYHQRDSKNELVRSKFPHDIQGVLDGQQRISSMYIALQGIYQTKRKYARKATSSAYDERIFYLDLLEKKGVYNFKFLTEEAAQPDKGKYYFRVRDALDIDNDEDVTNLVDKLFDKSIDKPDVIETNKLKAIEKITTVVEKFNDDQLISYFNIVNKDLDEILDIFVRVNSGGLILSKSDLLFSTLVAHWEDGRKRIENLIDQMNGPDGKFKFNTDFLMRTCLFLIDAPMNFKIQSFDAKNIKKIKDNWQEISKALLDSVDMLRDFGFDHTRLSSNYALTPIAYYLIKGGVANKSTKPELRKFVTHSLLKQIYSGQADSTLRVLRDSLRDKKKAPNDEHKLINPKFSFSAIKSTKFPGGKRISITKDDIADFLKLKKGNQTFLVLSALYPHLKVDQIEFHQDHMHPQSKFRTTILSKQGLSQDQIESWIDMKDQLPNLQLLKGIDNKSKQAMHLVTWVKNAEKDEGIYRKENYIPKSQSLAFEEFETFFEKRKDTLEKKLIKEFTVS
jgi:uncharacterized protein with ParB-like and HNH nuclease domain